MDNITKKLSKFIPYLIIISFVFLASRTLLTNKIPRSDDYDLHAMRVGNYYLALKQGQFPPRWAPNSNNGFGYPIFNFTYPLPYMIGSTLFAWGVSMESSLNMIVVFSIVSAALGVYLLSRSYIKDSLFSSLIAITYISFPYFLLNIFVRGALGEILFMSIVPWAFYFIKKLISKPTFMLGLKTSIILFLLIISHPMSVAYTFPVIVLWYLLESKNNNHLPFVGSIFIAFLLAQFQILPMLFEAKFTLLSGHQSVGGGGYYLSFVPMLDLFWSKWTYGGFEGGMGIKTSKMLGISSLLILLFSLFEKKLKSKKMIMFWVTIFIGAALMTTKYSGFIWENVSLLQYFQFPYRLISLISIATIFLLIHSSKKIKKFIKIGLLLVATFNLISFAKPISYVQKPTTGWLEHPGTSDAANENMPMWFDTNNVTLMDNDKIITTHQAQINTLFWSGSHMIYKVTSDLPTTVFQKTAYFPGWQVWVNQKKVDILYKNNRFPGVVAFDIPAGENHIEVIHTQDTLPRKVGNTLSVLTVVFLLGILIKTRYASKN